jgi:CO dehydrogenase nickel-insertion accessory protein CooC1
MLLPLKASPERRVQTMRQVLSLLLISILILPAAPVSAQDADSNPELADRLGNMNAEAEKFLGKKPELAKSSTADTEVVVSNEPFEDYTTAEEREKSDSDRLSLHQHRTGQHGGPPKTH